MFWMVGQRTNWLAASAERRFSYFQIRVIEAWSTALQMLWYILIHDSGSNQHNNLLLKPSVNSSPDVFANASKTAMCELFTLLGHCRVADSSWLHSTHGQSAIARSVSQLPVNTLKTRLLLLWQLNLAEFACPKAVQIWLRSYDFARQSLAVQACNRLRSFSVTPRLQSLSMLTAVTAIFNLSKCEVTAQELSLAGGESFFAWLLAHQQCQLLHRLKDRFLILCPI